LCSALSLYIVLLNVYVMGTNLKREFLSLLEMDVEFRYAVAGYLGLSEILKKMNALIEEQHKLWENQNRLWEEVKALREEQNKLWEGHNRLSDSVGKLEVRVGRLERSVDRLRDAMIVGFGELCISFGVSFESFVRRFLSRYLRGVGVLSKGGRLVRVVVDGEEINIFSEEPLIVGEVMAYAKSVDEINKLLRKINLVKEKYDREPLRKYLIVLRASKSVVHELKKIARENNIELILGKIM